MNLPNRSVPGAGSRVPGRGTRDLSHELENMSELLFFRLEVLLRRFGRRDFEGDALDDLQAEAFDRDVLRGVVRHQPDLADTEVAQDLRSGAVVADVGSEAELRVCLDRVVSLLLQLVGFQFVDQADP